MQTASTADLSSAELANLRRILDAAFDGSFSDDDWVHACGGEHVWITEADRVVSHGSCVARPFTCSGRAVAVGYVEAVATAETDRRRGHGTRVMQRLGEMIRARHHLGALSTGAHRFYERLGWERWRGPTYVEGTDGPIRTPDDDGGIMILRTPRSPVPDLDGDIVCDRRAGDVW